MPSAPGTFLYAVSHVQLTGCTLRHTGFRIPDCIRRPNHAGSLILDRHKSLVSPMDQIPALPDEDGPRSGPSCFVPVGSVNIQIRSDQPVLSLVAAYALHDGDIPDGLCAQGRGDDGLPTVDRPEVEWITIVTQCEVDALIFRLPVEVQVAHFGWVSCVEI